MSTTLKPQAKITPTVIAVEESTADEYRYKDIHAATCPRLCAPERIVVDASTPDLAALIELLLCFDIGTEGIWEVEAQLKPCARKALGLSR